MKNKIQSLIHVTYIGVEMNWDKLYFLLFFICSLQEYKESFPCIIID
jgi:hypothetical protein